MLSRSFNIHVLASQQRGDAEFFGTARDNFGVVVALGNLSPQSRDMFFSGYKEDLEEVNGVGAGYMSINRGKPIAIQVPQIDVEQYNGKIALLKITDMLNYLDGYPVTLPCRYTNRQACYNTVYLISNIPLEEQYKNVQIDEPATWKAFLRRIHHVVEYTAEGCNSVMSAEAEEPHQQTFTELTDSDGELPF